MTLPRIISVENVIPFTIKTRWTTWELREIDLKPILKKFENRPDSSIGKILSAEVFETVNLDPESRTLYWEGLISKRLKDGNLVPAPLDFCPDILFENSRVVEF